MHLKSADPDLRTLVNRIQDLELDLQPEFQRGEVWSEIKQQRLIDSVLRDWQIPPVHIVVDAETNKQFVLDGQQRLAAIRDFVAGDITVNGNIEPADPRIKALHGATYSSLPQEVRWKFDRYAIRVFYISDYSPEEPGELFFRLNQNSTLTPAEQRNAFFGGARRQVKGIIEILEEQDLRHYYFGFSNARMAYDDIVARSLLVLEKKSLRQRISSNLLVDKYRSEDGFSEDAVEWLRDGIGLLIEAKGHLYTPIKLNKATALSWLIFASRLSRSANASPLEFGNFICEFEILRRRSSKPDDLEKAMENADWSNEAFAIYDDRSSARVGDVSSVVLRDFVIWIHYWEKKQFTDAYGQDLNSEQLRLLRKLLQAGLNIESIVEQLGWGVRL